MYMYVYVYVFICMYMYVYVYVFICMYMYVYVYVSVYTRHVRVCICKHVIVYTCFLYTCIHMYVYRFMFCLYESIYIYIHTHTHIYIRCAGLLMGSIQCLYTHTHMYIYIYIHNCVAVHGITGTTKGLLICVQTRHALCLCHTPPKTCINEILRIYILHTSINILLPGSKTMM
jgi:hypothetical protein